MIKLFSHVNSLVPSFRKMLRFLAPSIDSGMLDVYNNYKYLYEMFIKLKYDNIFIIERINKILLQFFRKD